MRTISENDSATKQSSLQTLHVSATMASCNQCQIGTANAYYFEALYRALLMHALGHCFFIIMIFKLSACQAERHHVLVQTVNNNNNKQWQFRKISVFAFDCN